MTRRIGIVTGTRAEYGLLRPVITALRRTPEVDVGLVATGVHLSEAYGRTIDEIARDSHPVWATVPMYDRLGDDFSSHPKALAAGIAGLDAVFAAERPDIVVVLGDRLEAIAAALAAFYRRLAVAHLHGGERSDYHIDDSTRHAVTRLAHLHFPATQASAERLRRMGEEEFRIHLCGAPGLDALRAIEKRPKAEVMQRYGFAGARPFAIFLFHPETTRWRDAGDQTRCVLDALLGSGAQTLALYPNGDPGSDGIIAALNETAGRVAVRLNLTREEFLQALCVADLLAGNSSCGLIEASYSGTPVLHVGERNAGREHGENVLFVPIEPQALSEGLRRVLEEGFKERARHAACPWGDGRAGERIAEVLARIPIGPDLLAKRLTV